MPLNFRNATEITAGDSGYNNSDAILPYNNGEGANQTVLRRPPEYLRERSEVVRDAFDKLEAVVSSDRGLMLLADPAVYITWGGPSSDGTGIFVVTPGKSLRFIPMTNPSTIGAANDIWNRLTYVFDTDKQFTLRSRLRVCEGSNNIAVKLFYEPGVRFGGPAGTDVEVTIDGSKNGDGDYDPLFGPVLVSVQLSHDGASVVSTWEDVIDGITAETVYANVWLEAAVTAGSEAAYAVDIERQFLWEGLGTGVAGNQVAGCDAQGYTVSAAEFVTFFTTVDNRLDDGDALVLDFPNAEERLAANTATSVSSYLLRLHRSEATNPPVPRSTSGHVNLMNAVPLCKVIGEYLYFINGIVIGKDQTGSLAPDNTLAGRLADQTAPDSGDTLVGASVKNTPTIPFPGDTTLPVGTVNSQLQRIYESLQKTNEMRYLYLYPTDGDQYAKLKIVPKALESGVKQIEVFNSTSKFSVDEAGHTSLAGDFYVGGIAGIGVAKEVGFSLKTSGAAKFGGAVTVAGNVNPLTNNNLNIGTSASATFAQAWVTNVYAGALRSQASDFIDVYQSLLPHGSTTEQKRVGDSTHHWSEAYIDTVYVSSLQTTAAEITVYGSVVPNTSGRNLGTNGVPWSIGYIGTVNSTTVNATTVATTNLSVNNLYSTGLGYVTVDDDLLPLTTLAKTLGSQTNTWTDIFARDARLYTISKHPNASQLTVYDALVPNGSGAVGLGLTGNRWGTTYVSSFYCSDIHCTSITGSGSASFTSGTMTCWSTAQINEFGSGYGGRLNVGLGVAGQTTGYATYTAELGSATGGNTVTITCDTPGCSVNQWVAFYIPGLKLAIPLFVWDEMV